jgi:uncharacterized protein
MKRLLGFLMIVSASMMGSMQAAHADYAAGWKAIQSGDFATALQEWKPLAEQGNAKAQVNLGT